MTLQSGSDVHKRGYAFEALLAKLFLLFDMEPRLASSLDREQVDGALTFDTDDYVVTRRSRSQATRASGRAEYLADFRKVRGHAAEAGSAWRSAR